MSFKSLINKRMTKKVKFMGEDVEISKLTVSEIKEIQALAKENESATEDDGSEFKLVATIIGFAVADAADLSEEDFNGFPVDELSKLSNEIMKFSGLGGDPKA